MSSKKTNRFTNNNNKTSNKLQHNNKNQQNPPQKKLATRQPSYDYNQAGTGTKESSAGLVVSVHKIWPDLQLNQSRLFFECTLFLYSVLALFLQYLNLYKTLWWLPKSYWPYSLKYHLINPYLLSCIGLLLGVRVTKCFWDALGERVDYFCKGQEGWQLTCWKIFEYAIVKTPLTTIVCTSFMFSFTRIYLEFGSKALSYFFTPLISYIALFNAVFIDGLSGVVIHLLSPPINFLRRIQNKLVLDDRRLLLDRLANMFTALFTGPHELIDLESTVHLCSDFTARTREEASILLVDFELRCRYCVYTGLITAFFAIFMPRALLSMRTVSGHAQFMLIDDIWVVQLFTIVALTACSLYITYLFPINYFDLLYRCVVHLGYWESIQPPLQQQSANSTGSAPQTYSSSVHSPQQHVRSTRTQQNVQQEIYENYNPLNNTPYEDGTRIVHNGKFYIARSHPHFRTVAAEPGNEAHLRLYRFTKDPVRLVSKLCIFQGMLVAFEFWLLLLTTDWQQIVTLVLLMFANYLLLAKMFKDRIVIGRIYNPSSEDLQLIKQLKEEMETKRAKQREVVSAEKQKLQQKSRR